MADKEKKEVTNDDLQKEVEEIKKQVTSLTDENKQLKEQITQKDLEIAKLSLGGVERKITNEVKQDEEVSFDFDF